MQHNLAALIQQLAQPETFRQISDYVLSGVGLGLAGVVHRSSKRLRELESTRVKANLAFDDLVERKPEISRVFKSVMNRNGG